MLTGVEESAADCTETRGELGAGCVAVAVLARGSVTDGDFEAVAIFLTSGKEVAVATVPLALGTADRHAVAPSAITV